MIRLSTILLLSYLFIGVKVFSQNKDSSAISNVNTIESVEKNIIAQYSGGRFGYSGIHLTLYSDSTYIYSSWLHTGSSFKDEGTFIRRDSSITLSSKGYTTDKRKNKKQPFNFKNETYRIRNEKILLYTEKEERSDKSDYYPSYYTLYLDNQTKKQE